MGSNGHTRLALLYMYMYAKMRSTSGKRPYDIMADGSELLCETMGKCDIHFIDQLDNRRYKNTMKDVLHVGIPMSEIGEFCILIEPSPPRLSMLSGQAGVLRGIWIMNLIGVQLLSLKLAIP